MEIKRPTPMFGDFIGPWHKSFCFIPKQTYDGRWVWLRNVWRRRVQLKLNLGRCGVFWWFYSIEDLR